MNTAMIVGVLMMRRRSEMMPAYPGLDNVMVCDNEDCCRWTMETVDFMTLKVLAEEGAKEEKRSE